jgi:hypothetical protein
MINIANFMAVDKANLEYVQLMYYCHSKPIESELLKKHSDQKTIGAAPPLNFTEKRLIKG